LAVYPSSISQTHSGGDNLPSSLVAAALQTFNDNI